MPHSTNLTSLYAKTEEFTGRNNHNMQGTNAVGPNPIAVAVRTNGTTDSGNALTVSAEISRQYVNLYTIARLSGLGYRDARTVFSALDQDMGYVPDVPCIQELNDGSWELIVRRASIPRLQYRLLRIFPGCFLNIHYDPFEPNADEVERLGYERAKYCNLHSFISRATAMAKEALPVAGIYYQYLLDKIV